MSNYLVEFELQTMLTLKNGAVKEGRYMVCPCCNKLSDVEKMMHTETKSVCYRCIQTDLDYLAKTERSK